MAKKRRLPAVTSTERTHCQLCTFYVDGHQVSKQDPLTGAFTLFFFPIPGMQFHRKTEGTGYEKVGFCTPCSCATGKLVAEGYARDNNFISPKIMTPDSAPEKIDQILEKLKPSFHGEVPMPMDPF